MFFASFLNWHMCLVPALPRSLAIQTFFIPLKNYLYLVELGTYTKGNVGSLKYVCFSEFCPVASVNNKVAEYSNAAISPSHVAIQAI